MLTDAETRRSSSSLELDFEAVELPGDLTEGIGVVATREKVIVMRPGDTVHTPPGEEHWHGAVADQFMTHLAIWEGDDATWGDHVTDEEYAAAQGR